MAVVTGGGGGGGPAVLSRGAALNGRRKCCSVLIIGLKHVITRFKFVGEYLALCQLVINLPSVSRYVKPEALRVCV